MLRDNDILDPILENLHMPELVEELNVRLKQEQLLREEFYKKIQPGDKWEFINGKIIMHSPAKEKHTVARQRLDYLLQTYTSVKDLGQVRSETSLVSLTRNDYLPDILFFTKERAMVIHPNTWKYPIPDFVVEVLSDGTASTDRGIKKRIMPPTVPRNIGLLTPTYNWWNNTFWMRKKRSFGSLQKRPFLTTSNQKPSRGCASPFWPFLTNKRK